MMGILPMTSARAEPQNKLPTDVERYVRREFGDRNATWFVARIARSDGETPEPTNDGRLLRRAAKAIAAFF